MFSFGTVVSGLGNWIASVHKVGNDGKKAQIGGINITDDIFTLNLRSGVTLTSGEMMVLLSQITVCFPRSSTFPLTINIVNMDDLS